MNTEHFVKLLAGMYPLHLQESWDNAGIQVFNQTRDVTGILFALDCSHQVIDEAKNHGVNVIVTHHPLLFKSLKSLDARDVAGGMVHRLVHENIDLYSMHTNCDRVYHRSLCQLLELESCQVLFPLENDEQYGYGSMAQTSREISLADFLGYVQEKTGAGHLVYSGNPEETVRRVAVFNGSGSSMIEKIIAQYNPDCIITGDVTYHHMKYAQECSVSVIDLGHFYSEWNLVVKMKEDVEQYLTREQDELSLPLVISSKESNPFQIYS